LYFNSLTELCLYFWYVHVLRFVSRILNQDWIELDWSNRPVRISANDRPVNADRSMVHVTCPLDTLQNVNSNGIKSLFYWSRYNNPQIVNL